MSNKYILMIEDDEAVGLMYQRKLEAGGYQVKVIQDGSKGGQELAQGKRPDLLLLDVLLPKKDGFEILRDVRKNPQLRGLRVMILTNLAHDVDKNEGIRLGADDYIIKAFITPAELLVKVDNLLLAQGNQDG